MYIVKAFECYFFVFTVSKSESREFQVRNWWISVNFWKSNFLYYQAESIGTCDFALIGKLSVTVNNFVVWRLNVLTVAAILLQVKRRGLKRAVPVKKICNAQEGKTNLCCLFVTLIIRIQLLVLFLCSFSETCLAHLEQVQNQHIVFS